MYTGIKTIYVGSLRPVGTQRGLVILRRVACGKTHCHTCPHGPYYYLRSYDAKRRKSVEQYLGEEGSEAVQALLHGKLTEDADNERFRAGLRPEVQEHESLDLDECPF